MAFEDLYRPPRRHVEDVSAYEFIARSGSAMDTFPV
ncbi:hypothetical protein CEXT_502751, partial [Caerostris extrusa]